MELFVAQGPEIEIYICVYLSTIIMNIIYISLRAYAVVPFKGNLWDFFCMSKNRLIYAAIKKIKLIYLTEVEAVLPIEVIQVPRLRGFHFDLYSFKKYFPEF